MRTGGFAVLGALVTAGALCLGSGTASAQKIIVGDASGDAGMQVTVDVSLSAGGKEVAGTQNDIAFAAPLRVAAKANGKPDCVVNPDIDKGATSFAFRPSGCAVEACTGIRALVLSTDNVAPIADNSVMYTCKVDIAADAADGEYPLTITGVILSDPAGNAIEGASGQDGTVTVGTPGPVACDPPAVQVETVNVATGTTDAAVPVKVIADNVAGTQNDIAFSGARVKAKANGKPDCAVNPDIDKGATSFAFRPSGCAAEACTGIRALVLSTDNVAVIPTGSVLYTCQVSVPADASGLQALTTSGVILSDPAGNAIEGAHGCDGGVQVGVSPTGPALAEGITAEQTSIALTDASSLPASGTIQIDDEQMTYTGKDGNTLTGVTRGANGTTAAAHEAGAEVTVPAAPATPTPTATPPPDTPTPVVTSTPTAPPAPTNTPGGGTVSFDDDDGCQIATRSHGSVAWMLLIPVVGLLVLRRRSR